MDAADPRTRLSDELRVLARKYPRDTWATHADLGELARFWLQRHEMFRRLDEAIRSGSERALDEPASAGDVRPWLSRHVGLYLWQLEEHHRVEDLHYFPVFQRAEPRLAGGFELLERDHDALHVALEGIVERANAVLADDGTRPGTLRTELARFLDAHVALGRELRRHLDDEEDLVIPLILEHGERGLV